MHRSWKWSSKDISGTYHAWWTALAVTSASSGGNYRYIVSPWYKKRAYCWFSEDKKIYLSVWIIVFFLTGDRPGHRPKNPLLWWLWPRSRVRTDQSKSGLTKAQTWPGPLQKWSCGSFQCLWQDLYQHCSTWEVSRDATKTMIVLQKFTIFLGLLQGWPSLLSVIHSMSWYMWLKHELNMWHKIRLTFDIVSSMLWPNGTYYTSVSLADLHLKPVWSHTSWHDNLWLACCLTNILA